MTAVNGRRVLFLTGPSERRRGGLPRLRDILRSGMSLPLRSKGASGLFAGGCPRRPRALAITCPYNQDISQSCHHHREEAAHVKHPARLIHFISKRSAFLCQISRTKSPAAGPLPLSPTPTRAKPPSPKNSSSTAAPLPWPAWSRASAIPGMRCLTGWRLRSSAASR